MSSCKGTPCVGTPCKGTPCVFLAHLRGDAVPLRAGEVVSPAPDLGVQLLLVLVPEGRVTHQQYVEDHTWISDHYNPDNYPGTKSLVPIEFEYSSRWYSLGFCEQTSHHYNANGAVEVAKMLMI